jgi:hypothetical protein
MPHHAELAAAAKGVVFSVSFGVLPKYFGSQPR